MIARWLAMALMALSSVARAQTALPTAVSLPDEDRIALDAAVHELCGRRVALLGEAASHGDSHTVAFKAALVRRLVLGCRFDAIAFESGVYEFVALGRALRRGAATPAMVADAVGGVWKFDREFQPLVDFLFAQAKTGRLRLAGLDAQIGGLGEDYANDRMVPELAEGLDAKEATDCTAAFAARMAWRYPSDHPYGPAEHGRLLVCTAAMRRAVAIRTDVDPVIRAERWTMIDNIERSIGADLSGRVEQLAARERWLSQNFEAFAEILPRRSKVIVWGATVHLGKRVAAVPSFRGYGALGAAIHDRYGDKAYALGLAAGGGTYRVSRMLLPIDPPPPASLEAAALAGGRNGATFLDGSQLRRLGVRAGGVLDHAYREADWNDIVDGVVVFREEWPTHSTRPGY